MPCMITAHAGALGTKDNTLDSLKTCLDFFNGSGCVEVDVRFDAAGAPILTHDAPKPGENPPLLSEFFTLLQDYSTRVNLDLKSTANLPEVERLAEAYGVLPQVFFTGVISDWVEAVKSGAPKIPYYINWSLAGDETSSRETLLALAEEIIALGGIGLNTRWQNASEEMTEIMHRNGLLLSVWTANEEPDMRRMLFIGVDNITTRKPDLLRDIMSAAN